MRSHVNFFERSVLLPIVRAVLNIAGLLAVISLAAAIVASGAFFVSSNLAQGGTKVMQPVVQPAALEAALKAPPKTKVRETLEPPAVASLEPGDSGLAGFLLQLRELPKDQRRQWLEDNAAELNRIAPGADYQFLIKITDEQLDEFISAFRAAGDLPKEPEAISSDAIVSPELQQILGEFALDADPAKGEEYFEVYDLAAAATGFAVIDNGFYEEAPAKVRFSASLRDAFRVQKAKTKDLSGAAFVEAYTEAWEVDGRAKIEAVKKAAIDQRNYSAWAFLALVVAGGSLSLLMASALTLTLILIERNTRPANSNKESIPSSSPGALLGLLVSISAAALFHSAVQPASAQGVSPPYETKGDREAREKAAATTSAERNFQEDMTKRRSAHVGKTYVFNPKGQVQTETYSGRKMVQGKSQLISRSCLSNESCGLDREWGFEKFSLLLEAPTPFVVKGIGSGTCDGYFRRRGTSIPVDICYWYEVDVGGDAGLGGTPALLLLGQREDAAHWTLRRPGDSLGVPCMSYSGACYLSDPLNGIETNPASGMYLVDMPEVVAARKAEADARAAIEAAERKAIADKEAAERKAIADKEAATRKAIADKERAARDAAAKLKADQERKNTLVAKFGQEAAQAILNGNVIIGMSQEAVTASWGAPTEKRAVPPADEFWRYPNGRSVVFANKKVTRVSP